jgi:hypothetical protein
VEFSRYAYGFMMFPGLFQGFAVSMNFIFSESRFLSDNV